MYLSLEACTALVVCCFIHGFAALRLVKVSIPSYKLRGESVFLECQYELDKVRDISLINSYSPNRDHEHDNYQHDSQDEEWFSRRRLRAPQNKQKWREQPYRQQSKYDNQYQYSYHQKHPSDNSQFYDRHHPLQESYQQYHYQQPESKEMPDQQKYLYAYQTSSSPYAHSIYRGKSPAIADKIDASHSRAIDSYNVDRHSEPVENSRRMSPFGHAVPDNSFADSSEQSDQVNDDKEGEEYGKGEALYAIKWYKENEEFYRYVPKAKPPKTSYKVEGVRVIEEHSDSSRVLLRGLTINSTGLYRCEISAEAPNFSSVEAEGHMDVVYLPRDGPFIRGQQLQYKIGETLDLNCTSGKSHPASHLQWHINDETVLDELNLIHYNHTVHRHGLITTTLGLQMILERRHFHKGAMRIKCVASLSPLLWKGGKERDLQRRRPGLIDNRESMLLVHSSTSTQYKTDISTKLFVVLLQAAYLMEFSQLLLLQSLL
ncbi:uncharacterized protein LOC119640017 [Glossina fuscipes]|uniref:Uncharacterized protein LOC119640017 n=1 Tax=Glossina fuscipes TaxID=7396 RepID=A0A9C5ZBZ3_9MUSC|nr:uncharacterized protein LOC119640017 [Glossina fuscipes]KAI9579269.1 hypothetical protein GQX74_004741 [Glossina fuscipes]